MQPKVIIAIAAAVFSFGAHANQAPVPPKLDPGKAQMALFAQTCLSNAGDFSILADQLGSNLSKIPQEFLPLYLGKQDGAAWSLPTAAGTAQECQMRAVRTRDDHLEHAQRGWLSYSGTLGADA